MFDWINVAMGWVLRQLYELLESFGMGNYALAIFLFTLLINVVFLPLSIKQQKASAKQASLRPRLEALKQKCGDDQRRYQTEMQALYQKENVSMMGGCWTMLIRLPFLWAVWSVIREPLTYIVRADKALVDKAMALLPSVTSDAPSQLGVIVHMDSLVKKDPSLNSLASALNFDFFGINLADTPHFDLGFSDVGWIWLIPVLSFATAMLSSVISLRMQKQTNPQAGQMGCMMLTMPLLSLYIAFTVPGAVGFYWACSNVVNMIVQIFMHKFYGPYAMVAREEADVIRKRRAKELELKAKQ